MIICLSTTPAIGRAMVFTSMKHDAVNRAVEVRETVAGKGNNVARVVKTLGEQSITLGFAGGRRGEQMRSLLTAEGIEHDFVTVKHETRMCVTVIDRSNHSATELVEETPGVEPVDVDAVMRVFEKHLPQARAVVLAGSLAPGVPSDLYARCVAQAKRRSIPVVVDASDEPLRLACIEQPDVIKPNRSELARAIGSPVDTDEKLHDAIGVMLSRGAQAVVVTQGPGSVIVANQHATHQLNLPRVTPISAIGSGDSFAAGLIVGLVRGQSLLDAARLGAACGIANVLTPTAGFLHLADVERFLSQISSASH